MKKTIEMLLLLGLVAISTGCVSPYMVDRGRDAADIFTATVGVGGGAKARIGPLGAGLMVNVDYSGLKGGQLMPPSRDLKMVPPNGGDVHYLLFGSEFGNSSEYAQIRNKDYMSFYFLGIPMPASPCPDPRHPPSYWTQIDVAVGIGGNLKLGFNPGELLDFILGWTSIDIYNDDIELKKSNKPQERTSQ